MSKKDEGYMYTTIEEIEKHSGSSDDLQKFWNDNSVSGSVMTALKAEFGEGANAMVKGYDGKNNIRLQKIFFGPLGGIKCMIDEWRYSNIMEIECWDKLNASSNSYDSRDWVRKLDDEFSDV